MSLPSPRWLALACLGLPALAACATAEPTAEPPPPVPTAPDCNPIVGEDCLSGFPTSFYTVADKSTATGRRLDLPAAVMPATAAGPLPPEAWNRRDGFSPNGPVLALLPRRIDPAVLADETRPQDSTALTTATVLLDAATGKILPHMAELDLNASGATCAAPPCPLARQALILRPWTPPQKGRRIVVALTDRLKDVEGKPFARTPTFQRLVDGQKTGYPRIDGDLAAWQKDLDLLDKAGIPRARLLAAWHFDTASAAWTHGVALQARDLLLAHIGAKGLGYTIDKIEVDPQYVDQFPGLPKPADDKRIVVAPMHGDLALRLRARVEVPLFLTGVDKEATLNWTGVGAAIAVNGTTQRDFILLVPPSALKLQGKARLMLYGHGLLRGACKEGCVKPGDAEIFPHLANSFGVVAFGMDWWGLSELDFGTAATVASDFTLLPRLSDKLVQAAVQPIALARTVRHLVLDDPLLALGPAKVPPADAKADLVYYGNSLGGILGTTHAALNPDLTRMVMNVPAGVWSLLLNRSSNFKVFFDLLLGTVPDPWTQQLLFALSQTHWDLADPINFADHVLHAPFAGMPANRKALWPIAWGDSQVPNLGSGMLQRVAGVPLLGKPVQAWFDSPLDAAQPFLGPGAFVQWDPKRGTHPAGNLLPWPDNESHLATRWMPEFQQMVWRFLYGDGAVEQRYCLAGGRDGDGKLPCDLEEAVPKKESAIPPLPVLPPPTLP